MILALAAGPGLAAPSLSTPDWVPPVTVTGPTADEVGDVALDVSSRGLALLAWTVSTGGIETVRVARRLPGGAVGPSRPVSGNDGVAGSRANGPVVSVADDGSGLVAWQAKSGTEWTVRYRTVSPAGTFGPVRTASAPAPEVFRLSIDASRNGRVAIAWSSGTSLWGAVGSTAAGLGAAELLQSGGNVYSPQPGVDAQGNVVFAWERYFPDPSAHSQVETRVKPAGQPLGPVVPIEGLAPGNFAQLPKVAVAPGGTATLVYGYVAGSNDARTRYVVRSVAGGFATGSWGPPGWASADGVATTVDGHDVVALPDGGAVATYTEGGGGGSVVATTRSAGGPFGGHQPIAPPDVGRPALASGPTGVVAAVWTGVGGGGSDSLAGALRPAGGQAFGTVQQGLDTAAFGSLSDLVVDVDDQGNAYEAHVRRTCVVPQDPCLGGYRSAVRLTAYDAAPPVVSRRSIPVFAAAKRPADFTAHADDRIGPLSFAWRFGDGRTGQGIAAPHRYAKKGTYTATLTATDLAGTAVKRSGRVTVLAPALKARLKAKFAAGRTVTRVRTLDLTRLVSGTKLTVSCQGKGCPFRSRRITVTSPRLRLAGLLDGAALKKGVRLRVGLVASKPATATGRYFLFEARAGAKPLRSDGCLTPRGRAFGC